MHNVDWGLEGIMLETLAEAAHEIFCENRRHDGWTFDPTRNDKEKKHPLLVPYAQLPEHYKESNRSTVRRIPTKLAAAGCCIISSTTESTPPEFSADEIEKLAQLEHEMWMVDKLASGFSSGTPTPEEPLKNPYLVKWENLPRQVQDIDRDLVRSIPIILHKAGFAFQRYI